ncbi:MAG TPA: NAD(P) transhydrogenase subunit alpha [Longimicrobiales bacterium]|nr:NAD(P) transhydrogenase subunit alpha [Longimicrobiales bacterium]
MKIAALRELEPDERRVALTPAAVRRLAEAGDTVVVERGIGERAGMPDDAYADAGAELAPGTALPGDADLVVRVRPPSVEGIGTLPRGIVHMSLLDPYRSPERLRAMAEAGVTAISLEMVPRSTRAQKLDVLSSQASLAGYAAVITAAEALPKIFPMMMTPAGTIPAARVFVIGAGVAGLQAIATARRLGARVEAFDTRPVVAEEVRSLGAKFLEIDLGGETGQTEQGYAKELTDEQLDRQRAGMAAAIARADVVVTTAQLFGRPAPQIVSRDMITAMRPGSVVIDMATATGGNVEGSVHGESVDIDGVKVIGPLNLPAEVVVDASEMFASNVTAFVDEFRDEETGAFTLDFDDDILARSAVTHGGEVIHPDLKERA